MRTAGWGDFSGLNRGLRRFLGWATMVRPFRALAAATEMAGWVYTDGRDDEGGAGVG